jgi:HPt (histidine-containing phosphotransfer) domain-containing protein
MTAHAMDSDRKRCFAAGMDGYVSKPIDSEALFAEVEQTAAALAAPHAPLAAEPVTLDRKALLSRSAGDEELMLEVAAAFLEDCPGMLAQVQGAADRRDAEALRAAAHMLKGAAANLGADALAEIAAVLERLGAESRLDAAPGRMTAEGAKLLAALREIQMPTRTEVA